MIDLEDCMAHLPPKKFVVMSVKPKWVEKILKGEKTIEIRKTKPNCELPTLCYIYCTKDRNECLMVSKKRPRKNLLKTN